MKDILTLPDMTGRGLITKNIITKICGKKVGCDVHDGRCNERCAKQRVACEWCRNEVAGEGKLMTVHNSERGWIKVCVMCYAGFAGIKDPEEIREQYDIDNQQIVKDLNGSTL